MSGSQCFSTETECPFVCSFEEAKNEKELWPLVRCFHGQRILEAGLSLIVLCCPFSQCPLPSACITERLTAILSFLFVDLLMEIFAGWHNVKLCAIWPCIVQVIRWIS